MLYEILLIKADNEGIDVYEKEIGKLKGLYFDGNIIINSSIETYSEKACILAEELGHHYTTHGNILNQCKVENRKQERRARAWAYERLVSLNSLIEASKHCIRNRFELAEFLGVSERFIDEAIQYYKEKYGICHKVGDYIVYFEPLGVLKKNIKGVMTWLKLCKKTKKLAAVEAKVQSVISSAYKNMKSDFLSVWT